MELTRRIGDSAARRAFIGGSDARIIMGDDEAALLRLWQKKRGEVEPEDLSGNLLVQLGAATEDLNRRWYEANTGEVNMTETSAVRQRIVTSIHRGASCSASVGFGILPSLIGAKSDVMPNAAETANAQSACALAKVYEGDYFLNVIWNCNLRLSS
jgi:hypothetical protein